MKIQLSRLILVLALLATSGAAALPGKASSHGGATGITNISAPAAADLDALYGSAQHCPPLPPSTGRSVAVGTEAELWNAVNTAQEGDVILLADGTYNLGQNGHYVWIDTPGVTLRSASGNREAVILDDNYDGTEIVSIIASNVTIADLTIKRAGTHPIHVTTSDSGDTLDTLIYNVHIIDPREQAIKINPHTAQINYPDYGEIACSYIELTDEGRPHVNPTAGGCYTGGVDAHQARGWKIRDNVIEGFWCPNGLSEHGVHMWRGCRDTVVERNVFIDNARGVGFGLATSGDARTYADNPCPEAGGGYVDHYGGVIRNNFIFASRSELFSSSAGFDCGICLWQACHATVVHNSVVSTQAPFSSVEWRFDNTYADITNNLVSHNLMDRGGHATLAGNLDSAPLSLFVDGANGDLHLAEDASDAVDQGVSVEAGLCDDDIDGDARPIGPARDIGADEYGAPSPTLTLLSPNGGETWVVGTEQQIRWSSNLAGSVRLDYSTDGFASASAIAVSTDNDGTYTWTVPDNPSASVLVRVSSTLTDTISDTSDAVFTIAGPHTFEDSFKRVSQAELEGGETITYTIVLYEATRATLVFTDTIPMPLTYVPGSANVEPAGMGTLLINDSLHWSGTVTGVQPVTLTFGAQVPVTSTAWVIINRAQISRNGAAPIERIATSVLGGFHVYLPLVLRDN